jgi:enamine deaminase RidA (YjgF/YER057c/UK114 family)
MSALFTPIGEAAPGTAFSPGFRFGDEIAISGLTARGADGHIEGGHSMRGQADAVFAKLQKLLQAAGADLGNVYKLVIYVTDMTDRAAVNEARQAWLRPPFPCSTLICVSALADPALRIEIDAFTHVGFRRHAEPG